MTTDRLKIHPAFVGYGCVSAWTEYRILHNDRRRFGHETVSRWRQKCDRFHRWGAGLSANPRRAKNDTKRAGTIEDSEYSSCPAETESFALSGSPGDTGPMACLIEPFTVGCGERRLRERGGIWGRYDWAGGRRLLKIFWNGPGHGL